MANEQALLQFHHEARKVLEQLSKKHGVNLQPMRAMVEEGALHVAFSVTTEASLAFYGSIWVTYQEQLGLPDYLEPGMNVINPDTGDEWVLIGLDPANVLAPVKVMNNAFEHFWIDLETAKELQPM